MTEAQILAALRPLWFHAAKGARKPLARYVRLPFNTLHRFVRGRITLPTACMRRVSKALKMIERGELALFELQPGIPRKQLWAANKASHEWRRREPRRRAAEVATEPG